MMSNLSVNQVYLATGITDMRKSINGLSIIVAQLLERDPFDGSVFVFCNRQRDKLKMLHWEHSGFWLYYRRLDKGEFQWPSNGDQQSISLSLRELHWLLDGLSPIQSAAHPAVSGLIIN